VWLESNRFGSQASVYLSDTELKAIRDLGVASRSRVVTEGVVSARSTLEVAVYMNNSCMEVVVRSDVVTCERGEMAMKMAEMEVELASARKANSEKDNMIAFLKKKADLASRYYDEVERSPCPI